MKEIMKFKGKRQHLQQKNYYRDHKRIEYVPRDSQGDNSNQCFPKHRCFSANLGKVAWEIKLLNNFEREN